MDLREFLHPKFGNEAYLTDPREMGVDVWTSSKFDAISNLENLKKGLTDNAFVCFSNCNAGLSEDLGSNLALLLNSNVLLNRGSGGTSGAQIRTFRNPKTREITRKEITQKLLIPGPLATKETRHKGFMLFPSDGSTPIQTGVVKLNDQKDKPLEIPPKG